MAAARLTQHATFRLLALVLACFGTYVFGMALSNLLVSGFGRVALRVNYGEFGFIKRGLVGTLLQPVLPDHSYQTIINSSISFGLAIGALLAMGSSLLMLRCNQRLPRLLFLLSPATFLQLGYTFSWFDATFYMLFVWQVILLRDSAASAAPRAADETMRSILIGAIGSFALLIHEAYLLAVAPLLAWFCLKRFGPSLRAWLPLLMISITLGFLVAFGRYEAGPLALAQQLGLPLQEAPAEFTSTLSENVMATVRSFWLPGYARGSLPALAYVGLLAWLGCRSPATSPSGRTAILLALSPLLLGLIGADLPRWCGMAGFNLLLLALVGGISLRGTPGSPWPRLALLAGLAGPMGVVGSSFPLTIGALGRIF
jgi:hypothetical protein